MMYANVMSSPAFEAALSPAENLSVSLDEEAKIAHIKAPDDQLSMAIGKDGQNARLAAKLTGYRIEVETDEKAGKKKIEDKDEKEDEKKEKEKKKDIKKKAVTKVKKKKEEKKKEKIDSEKADKDKT